MPVELFAKDAGSTWGKRAPPLCRYKQWTQLGSTKIRSGFKNVVPKVKKSMSF
jgi:hypothetical protein